MMLATLLAVICSWFCDFSVTVDFIGILVCPVGFPREWKSIITLHGNGKYNGRDL